MGKLDKIYRSRNIYCLPEPAILSISTHLALPRNFYAAMVEHAQAELPNECCGLLAGVRDGDVLRVEAWHPLVNEAASAIEYRSEPRSMFQAVKAMRPFGHDIVAIYHSHPTSAPIPSRTDLERNFSADVVNLIISLKDAEPLMRGWWLTENAFEEAAWRIIEP